MKISVKVFATLAKYLPARAVKNIVEMDVEEGMTPEGMILHMNIPLEQCHLVLVDGVYINPAERSTRALTEGEVLAIWPPVAGG